MKRKVIARNSELKDIINEMNIEDVETIYNTVQSDYGDFLGMLGFVELGSAVGKVTITLLQLVLEPNRMIFNAVTELLISWPLLLAAIKRSEYKSDHERVDEITCEHLDASYNKLSLGTQIRLYLNAKRRIRKDEKKAKIKK